MNSTKAIRILCAALLIWALLLCGALADGADIEGTATREVEFYVYTQSGTSLTFTQEKGTVYSSGGMRSTIYGGYDITWYPTGQPYAARTESLTGRSASIALNRGVSYTVRVTPFTLDRLKTRDAYLGFPGTYERWAVPSEWTLTGSNGCLVSSVPFGAAATPTPTPWRYIRATATPTPWTYIRATATPTPWTYIRATATPTPWTYSRVTATPAPSGVTAQVYVFYRQPDGKLITYSTETLAPGTHMITSRLNVSYYTPLNETYQFVTVSQNGVAQPGSVTFYYTYNSGNPFATPAPTPAPTPVSAQVEILYKKTDGALLYSETRQLTVGTHMITYDNRFEQYPWLVFCGPASYHVTVYANGQASVGALTFYFTVTDGYAIPPVFVTPSPTPIPALNEALTDQQAVIGAEKIFPRPKPGKGKNTFNYEAIGQKVTVHSKALSLTNDGSWWVCISANLNCWGEGYVIDHEWIKSNYLSPTSFDLDAVPLDPEYM